MSTDLEITKLIHKEFNSIKCLSLYIPEFSCRKPTYNSMLNHYSWHYNNYFSSPILWLLYFSDCICSTNIILCMLNYPSLKPSRCSGQHMSVIVLGLIKSPHIKTRDPNALGSLLYYYKPRKLTSYLLFAVLQATKVNKLPTWIILMHLF